MPNSPQIAFLAHNSTVKAWCWTGTSTTKTLNPTQDAFDAVNFIDGYNLRLDAASQTGIAATTTDVYGGALRFAFITPMSDTKYKVFVQYTAQGSASGPNIGYAHVLNSTTYPKTTTGFWVRCGTPTTSPAPDPTNTIATISFGPDGWFNNLRVVVL
jgi:hypothetical protein